MSENKDHADVKIHPPVLTFIFIILAYVANWFVTIEFVSSASWVKYFGLGLAVVGLLLPFIAIREFIKARTTVNPHGSVTNIISSGIYRYTRNPIYLGFVFMLIGFLLFSNSLWGLILSPVLVICFNELVIKHEEAYLEKKFGEQYTNYKSSVKRWI